MLFAGTTVAISITGLAIIGIDFITKLGIGSALGVLTAVLLANSLLPAILALLGHKIDRGRLGLRGSDDSREGQAKTPVAAWGRFVTSNAKVVLPVAVVILLVVASPVIKARLGLADAGTAPKNQTTRKAYDLLSTGLRPRVHRADPGRDRAQLRPQRRGHACSTRSRRCRASRTSSRPSTTRRPRSRRRWRS